MLENYSIYISRYGRERTRTSNTQGLSLLPLPIRPHAHTRRGQIRTAVYEFKARCPQPLNDPPTIGDAGVAPAIQWFQTTAPTPGSIPKKGQERIRTAILSGHSGLLYY